jgi:hypothetical protein
MVRELLDRGADVEVKSHGGATALGYAARNAGHRDERYLETTILMLEHGAIPTTSVADRLRKLAESDEANPTKRRLRDLLDDV